MRFLSVCSGIEAASVAWHDLGFECVGVSEIEKFPSEVLKYHYPSVPNLGDMTKFKEWNDDLAPDLLVGGTPCQSFSVAGLRKGMDDPRGNLALTYVAIAEKYKPRWFVWENVPGVLSSNGGKDFASFITAMANIGYGIAYRVLDAQFFGVPQRRRRVFVVGYLGDWRPATAVLFEPRSVFGNTAKGRKARKGITASPEKSIRANSKQAVPYDLYQITAPINKQNREVGDPCHTLARDNAAYASIIEIDEPRDNQQVTSYLESGFAQYKQTGTAGTLKAVGGVLGGGSETFLAQSVYENHPNDSRVKEMGDVCQTVTNRWGTGGGNVPFVRQTENTMRVRRLTPVECERLQGFPDNWTQIPYGKRPKEQCPDGHRYKSLGNSMAVPVMRWIGRRIKLFESLKEKGLN
jgi:DNA (cytosine-5)-methyltransferase 1